MLAFAIVCEVTSIVLATVVVTLGVDGVVVVDVVEAPFSTSMGFAVSTPEKLTIPPAAALKPRLTQVLPPETLVHEKFHA